MRPRKHRLAAVICLLFSLLLTGLHADSCVAAVYDTYSNTESPSINCRAQYTTHHDMATQNLLRREQKTLRMEAEKKSSIPLLSSRHTAFWCDSVIPPDSYCPVSLTGFLPVTFSSTDRIIRYIHDQDGEKDSFFLI